MEGRGGNVACVDVKSGCSGSSGGGVLRLPSMLRTPLSSLLIRCKELLK